MIFCGLHLRELCYDRHTERQSRRVKHIMSICMLKPLKQGLKNNAFWAVENVFHSGQNFNSIILKCVFVDSRFILVSAESVKFVNDNKIPLFFATILNHPLKIGSIIVCSGHCTVNIGVQNDYVIGFSIVVAHSQLTFDRLFCLAVARIASINYSCFCHFSLLLIKLIYFVFQQNGDKRNWRQKQKFTSIKITFSQGLR